MMPTISTPDGYDLVATPAPFPGSAWFTIELTYGDTSLYKGNYPLIEVPLLQDRVNTMIKDHMAAMAYQRSLTRLWNDYPMDWVWKFLQLVLKFKYLGGAAGGDFTTHYFVRGRFGFKFTAKARRAITGRVLYYREARHLPRLIEEGFYE